MDITYRSDHWLAVLATAVLLHTSSANGQPGGPYDVGKSAIAGGGVTAASGGSYRVGATIGQPVAGTESGNSFFVGAGFWGGAGGMAAPTVTASRTGRMTPTPTATATSTPNPSPAVSPSRSTAPTATGTVTTPTPTPTPRFVDVNCDGRLGAADVVALLELIVRGDSGACGSADSNGDGRVDAEDIDATIEVIFQRSLPLRR